MRSSNICTAHAAMFAGLMVASPTTSIVVLLHSPLLPGRCLFYLCAIGVVTTLLLWWLYDGCPCTLAEKRALRLEGKGAYDGPWLPHYAQVWFDLHLSPFGSNILTFALLLVPMIIGILNW